MNIFVTGGAGFVGSNMVDRLLADERNYVTVYDNLSTGNKRFLWEGSQNARLRFVKADLLDYEKLKIEMSGSDFVFHFAANADIRYNLDNPRLSLEQNTLVTFNVLEAMRHNGIRQIVFSSTGSVYGEAQQIPTPEDCAFPVQTSLYAASKLACEGMIEAYAEGYGFTAYIFRFVSLLGERYSHGHVFDFVKKLHEDPTKLRILGNGKQRKSYLYIQDCLDAIQVAVKSTHDKVNIFNLGVDGYCEVNDSARWIADTLGVSPEFEYSGGDRGWVGDNPFIYLDTSKIRRMGWAPKCSIEEGVRRTAAFLQANPWIIEERG